jgi:Cu+-exporting ATPase
MEMRDRQINDATAETLRVPRGTEDRLPGTRAAEVRKAQIVQQAEAAVFERVRNADAERARFIARYQARTMLTVTQELELMRQAANAVRSGQSAATAYREYEQKRRDRIAVQAAVTDFRLFWDALGNALRGREKMIVDAENVPGRRHLFLVDPETFRAPAVLPSLKRRTTETEASVKP